MHSTFGKTEKTKEMQNAFLYSDWFYKINLLVLQLAPCHLLQLAPKKDFIKKVSYFK